MFAGLLGRGQVIAPSANAAGYMRRAFPGLAVQVYPHPENFDGAALQTRAGSDDEIVMIGAIGGHKGSARLLELARRARMTHPHLRFRVIGYTDIDEKLAAVGNVTITGRYKPEELPGLIAKTRGRLALFLFTWPETYSYTLSEAVKHGFIPLVPDIGAPAERVRAAGYGAVFGFPADPVQILQLIDEIAAGRRPECASAGPQAFYPPRAPAAEIPAPAKAKRKSPAPAK
jgi:glycosyltransferase involved in cell wall biosynthesis